MQIQQAIPAGDERMWRGQNLREELVDIGESVKLTVRQRILDVAGFKIEKMALMNTNFSSEKTAKLYNANLVLARSTEPVSTTFVDSAMTIYRRALSDPAKAEVLALCDHLFLDKDHPFNSIYTLQGIIDRAQTPQKILSTLIWLVDHYRMNYIDLSTFSVRKIKDPKDSYVNVCTFKCDVRNLVTGTWLDGLDILPEAKEKCRSVFACVDSVRRLFSPYPDTDIVDTTFMAGWPQSAPMTFQFIEDLCFSNTFDNRYKDARKSYLEIDDFMAYPSVQERIQEIQDQIKAEKPSSENQAQTPAATPAPPSIGTTPSLTTTPPSASTGNMTGEVAATGFDSLSECDQDVWAKVMRKLISSHIKLLVDEGPPSDLISAIRACPLAMTKTDPTGSCSYYGKF